MTWLILLDIRLNQGQFDGYQPNGYTFVPQQQQQQLQQQHQEFVSDGQLYSPNSNIQTSPHPVSLMRVVDFNPGKYKKKHSHRTTLQMY